MGYIVRSKGKSHFLSTVVDATDGFHFSTSNKKEVHVFDTLEAAKRAIEVRRGWGDAPGHFEPVGVTYGVKWTTIIDGEVQDEDRYLSDPARIDYAPLAKQAHRFATRELAQAFIDDTADYAFRKYPCPDDPTYAYGAKVVTFKKVVK